MNPRIAFIGAPLLTFAYGAIRLLSEHGPGLAWTTGHLAFLVALGLYAVVLLHLDRHTHTGFTVLGFLGLAAFAAQFLIDLVVGFMSADRTEMSDLFGQVYDVPGLEVVVQIAGPPLFYVALFAMLTHLAIKRLVPYWIPVAVLVASLLPVINLDLLPISAAIILVAFSMTVREIVDLEPARP
ncbi:hypothetical protein [Herbidospora mongoliensis]|uniref:hypothetical protein n=1 Tax=Herbidospora mongoliensis TaxID=688067 RepID=UPI000831F36E|nr:hypothetical protein [Herbidospora mongoliensis]